MKPDCLTEIHPFTNRWLNFNEPALIPEAKSAWVINQEKSYFGFLPNHQIKHLIIGSFPIWASVHHDPPQAGFDFAFFYCSRVNGFFPFLEVLNGYRFFPDAQLTTAHQKMQSVTDFFLQRELGITDILEKVQRTDARCISNLDRDLNTLLFNNLCALLDDCPNITHLYFTSNAVANWCRRELRKGNKTNRKINGAVLFGPGPMAGIAAAGILNRDERDYGFDDSIRFHTTQIPFIDKRSDVERLKISKWAVRLENISDLVRPEILNHPSFIAIKNRL